jgi:aspartyl/glutamyl-tRNA(Asn/Gln) amidotransferase C subunit
LTQEPGNQSSHEISEEIFLHLVELAAIHLDDDEAEYLLRELNEQLKAIRELDAIEIEGDVPITSHGVPYSDAMRLPLREDQIASAALADDILEQAPQVDERSIIVPDIPHEEIT